MGVNKVYPPQKQVLKKYLSKLLYGAKNWRDRFKRGSPKSSALKTLPV